MKVVSLKEILTTRFMIDSMSSLMEQTIYNEIEKGNIVDIAHVNFTPANMTTFLQIIMNVKSGSIIDSFSKDRNDIIQTNFERVALQKNRVLEDISAPQNKPRTFKGIIDLINSLEKDKVYNIIHQKTLAFDIPFVVFLQLVRPSIQVDLGAYANDVFRYVANILYSKNRQRVIDSTNEYVLFCKGETKLNYSTMDVVIEEKDSNKPFTLYKTGETSWTQILDNSDDFYLIPKDFGRVRVLEDERLKDVYSGLANRCREDLLRYAKINWKTLKSVLIGGN